ncbi:MAG TPA: tRNA (adenosine(37)-N6)-threonylcarbamoyltransferase complex ATPase subunit type 1 TsaE [Verrucomicrobiae bacterium]|nr:tRNA (adenosine(37)-N6)-threonylcarbamoyltransferase complex ATPase subunit type 1 TsaE [Verrucomicrobiae bacterium]
MRFTSRELSDTLNLGKLLGELARPGDVFCLLGDLGAGKTALAQGVALGLRIDEPVSSPTFTLIHEYMGRLPFFHMDLYRLGSSEEGEELGLKEYFWGKGVCVVEWPQVVADALPQDILEIHIQIVEDERHIELIGHGPRSGQIIEEVTNKCGF